LRERWRTGASAFARCRNDHVVSVRSTWRSIERPTVAGLPMVLLLALRFCLAVERGLDVCACELRDAACALLIFLPVCAFSSLRKSPGWRNAPAVSSAAT